MGVGVPGGKGAYLFKRSHVSHGKIASGREGRCVRGLIESRDAATLGFKLIRNRSTDSLGGAEDYHILTSQV